MDKETVKLVNPTEPRPRERPLSPRLIYHVHVGMAASFLHRVTGVALFLFAPFGLLLLSGMSQGKEAFNETIQFLHHPVINLLLFFLLFGFIFHLINGIRYILLDRGIFINSLSARRSALFTLIFSFLFSVLVFMV